MRNENDRPLTRTPSMDKLLMVTPEMNVNSFEKKVLLLILQQKNFVPLMSAHDKKTQSWYGRLIL